MCWPFLVWCLGKYIPIIIQSRCQRCQVLPLSVIKFHSLTANITLCLKCKIFPFLILPVDKYATDVRQLWVVIMTRTRKEITNFQVSCVSWSNTLSFLESSFVYWSPDLLSCHRQVWGTACLLCSACLFCSTCQEDASHWYVWDGFSDHSFLVGGGPLSSEVLLQTIWDTLARNPSTQMHGCFKFFQSAVAFRLSDKRYLWLSFSNKCFWFSL